MCFSAVHNRVSLYLSSVAVQALPSYVWSVKAEVDCTLLLIFREFRRCKGWLWVNKAHCMFPMFVLWWKAPLKVWSSLPIKVGLAWLAKPLGSVEYLHGLRFLGLSGEAHPSQLESVPAGISCASPLYLVSPFSCKPPCQSSSSSHWAVAQAYCPWGEICLLSLNFMRFLSIRLSEKQPTSPPGLTVLAYLHCLKHWLELDFDMDQLICSRH